MRGLSRGRQKAPRGRGDERQEGTPLQWNRQKGGRRVVVPGGGGSESQERRQIVEFIQRQVSVSLTLKGQSWTHAISRSFLIRSSRALPRTHKGN